MNQLKPRSSFSGRGMLTSQWEISDCIRMCLLVRHCLSEVLKHHTTVCHRFRWSVFELHPKTIYYTLKIEVRRKLATARSAISRRVVWMPCREDVTASTMAASALFGEPLWNGGSGA